MKSGPELLYTFDSFNARHSPEADVGRTFIDIDQYHRLCQLNHSLVLGPRGSGKTTLLKMLTVAARHAWKRQSEIAPQKLPFTAIYIPTDVHFQRQLQSVERCFSAAPHTQARVSRGAIATSVAIACVDCFLDRIHFESLSDPQKERDLSEKLSEGLKLDTVPTLELLRLSLRKRMIELTGFVRRILSNSTDNLLSSEAPNWLDLDLVEATLFACEAFDTTFGFDRKDRWAWCFDELELAPSWLLNDLFSYFRSIDQKIILKLGTSPHPRLNADDLIASALNDFDPIKLWGPSMVRQRHFCNLLASQVIESRLGSGVRPDEILGLANWFGDDDQLGLDLTNEPYSQGSDEWLALKEEAKQDPTLSRYLTSKGIDPSNPVASNQHLRDSVLRKIKPLVLFRKNFSHYDTRRKRRSRKGRKLRAGYFGVPTVFDISDGNPRFLKRIFEEMCAAHRNSNLIDRNTQSRIIEKISLQFYNYIRGIPGSQTVINGKPIYLFSLLHSIGKHFSKKILLDDFSADPTSSFVVNEDTPPELVLLLETAAEHAAIIALDQSDDTFERSSRGQRYRLSYLLAPLCRLPLRVYGSRGLLTCLSEYPPLKSLSNRDTSSGRDNIQETLF